MLFFFCQNNVIGNHVLILLPPLKPFLFHAQNSKDSLFCCEETLHALFWCLLKNFKPSVRALFYHSQTQIKDSGFATSWFKGSKSLCIYVSLSRVNHKAPYIEKFSPINNAYPGFQKRPKWFPKVNQKPNLLTNFVQIHSCYIGTTIARTTLEQSLTTLISCFEFLWPW